MNEKNIEYLKDERVRYRDLSWPLKFAVVSAWVTAIIYAIFLLVGFVQGIIAGV